MESIFSNRHGCARNAHLYELIFEKRRHFVPNPIEVLMQRLIECHCPTIAIHLLLFALRFAFVSLIRMPNDLRCNSLVSNKRIETSEKRNEVTVSNGQRINSIIENSQHHKDTQCAERTIEVHRASAKQKTIMSRIV